MRDPDDMRDLADQKEGEIEFHPSQEADIKKQAGELREQAARTDIREANKKKAEAKQQRTDADAQKQSEGKGLGFPYF